MLAAGFDLIVDEEFAAEDEEQNDARDDLRDVFVQAEVGSDLHRALVEERQQGRDQDHDERVHLGEPGHDDRGEAAAAGRFGRAYG